MPHRSQVFKYGDRNISIRGRCIGRCVDEVCLPTTSIGERLPNCRSRRARSKLGRNIDLIVPMFRLSFAVSNLSSVSSLQFDNIATVAELVY